MTVLILTHSRDNECIDNVSRAIEARGGSVFRLDTDRFPTELLLAARCDPEPRSVLRLGERELDVAEVTALWHRRLSIGGGIPTGMNPQLRGPSVEESRRTLMGLVGSLTCFTLDPLPRIRHAEHKQLQLRVAHEVGLDIPRTLFSNDPEAVRAFAAACDGRIVTKMLASFAVQEEGQEKVVFTNPVSPADLEDLDGLRYCPMTFQELVDKRLELRVTVVGDRVFSAAIDSQALERSRHDWRREGVALLQDWQTYELPADVEQSLLALMDRFGTNYGAIDLILTPDGRHVFLEINPVGEFFWLERHPGLPISEAIADVLLGQAFRRQVSGQKDTLLA